MANIVKRPPQARITRLCQIDVETRWPSPHRPARSLCTVPTSPLLYLRREPWDHASLPGLARTLPPHARLH
jgi:hypothetical protein